MLITTKTGMMIGRKRRIYKRWVWVGRVVIGLSGGGAWAATVPETHALYRGEIALAIVAQDIVYRFVSNEVWRSSFGEERWERVGVVPVGEAVEELRAGCASPGSAINLYVLGLGHLYTSRDGGVSWGVRRLTTPAVQYNDVFAYPEQDNLLLLATSDGAWVSRDEGASFSRFFSRVNRDENHVTAIAGGGREGRVYIATRGGMFVSSDGGKTVAAVYGLPKGLVERVAVSPLRSEAVAFVCQDRLFYSESRLETFRLVSALYSFRGCRTLAITSNGRDIVWSTGDGVYWGKDWLANVSAAPVRAPEEEKKVVARGESVSVVTVTVSAATASIEEEIMRREAEEVRYQQVMKRLQMEPSAREVVDAAIEYAQLHPDRIRKWLRDLNRSSWMPEFRISGKRESGVDHVSGIDAVGTLDAAAYHGRKLRNENVVWGGEVELAWDFEKIFFNPQEVAIDERRNRQTELRADVANTVTIYYFQRRNLLFKKLFDPPKDFLELSRLEFQIEELTTKIDTLSGGYFSRKLAERLKQEGEKGRQ
ncbi:MAG: hypothetical protein N2595_07840 [bacterium]|nr:hypothetical protein [bacterium]